MIQPRQQFDVLQAGRGIAALLVVLFHSNVIMAAGKYWGESIWSGFRMGHAGVHFFFVLSGFIIAFIHFRDVGRQATLPEYALKRSIRIYPIYWVALGLTVVPMLIFQNLDPTASRAPLDILGSALLLPGPTSPHLGVAWTLRHEVLFYLLFAVLILNRAAGLGVLGAWFICCALWTLFGPPTFPGEFYFSTYNLLFLFGMATAGIVLRWSMPFPAILAAIGICLFSVAGWYDVAHGESRALTLVYGAASAVGIAGFTELERSRGLQTPGVLKMLGDASYSIYLVHYLALSIGAKMLFAFGLNGLIPATLSFALLAASAVVVGLLFRWCIEKPMLKKLGRWRRTPVPVEVAS